VTEPFAINDAQFQKIVAAIDALYDHTPYWRHFLVTAVPIFLASLLGLGTALFLDLLKTRRESRKLIRERREKELAQLSSVVTAIGFNVESLIHTVMQQVLPHHEQSHAAVAAVSAVKNRTMDLKHFDVMLHSDFQPMVSRCPDPYLIDVEFFKEIPFILAKDPDLLKRSGWIIMSTRHLKHVLSERNKNIDLATIGQDVLNLDLNSVERQAEIQAAISNAEIVNCHQLFTHLLSACDRLEAVIKDDYKDVIGPKLKVQPPDVLKDVLKELERLAKEIVPDWPPPEPPAS
jgi:hypothetical protein